MTLEAIIKAEMKRRCPDDPRAAGKRVLRRCNNKRAAKVTTDGRRVR
jgi:hypothetical protein